LLSEHQVDTKWYFKKRNRETLMSIEAAALERLVARNAQAAMEEILAQVMLELEATCSSVFADRGELKLIGGVGVNQDCIDRTHATWATSAAALRQGRPSWHGSWCLWPCPAPRGLLLVYVAGATLRVAHVRETVAGIARLLALLNGENAPGATTEFESFVRQTTVEELERKQLTLLLHESDWNIARVARARGVTRVTVYNWMRRLGIERLKVRRGLKILRNLDRDLK
jgi:hypothetical protein